MIHISIGIFNNLYFRKYGVYVQMEYKSACVRVCVYVCKCVKVCACVDDPFESILRHFLGGE